MTAETFEAPRASEGFSYLQESHELHDSMPGTIVMEPTRELDGGTVHIGMYRTERAEHRVGIYKPENYDPSLPVVLMTTALGTGVRGHNQMVAEEFMQNGLAVALKGAPRYYNRFEGALTLTEDTNELLGFAQQVEHTRILGKKIEELFLYGESQGAMKALGALALADKYGFGVRDSLIVAPCYLQKIDMSHPIGQITGLFGLVKGTMSYVRQTSKLERARLRGTMSRKDMHHHAAVIPVLLSGETGKFIPHIDTKQQFTVQLYAKDSWSSPRRSQALFQSRFPNATTDIDPKYGHIDGIMSEETTMLRGVMAWGLKERPKLRIVPQLETKQ